MTARAVALPVAGVALAAGAALAIAIAPHNDVGGAPPWLALATGAVFATSGVIAHVRRPANRVGLLLIACATSLFVLVATVSPSPLLFTIGLAFNAVVFATLVHLMLAYPTGTLTRGERRLTLAGYVLAFGGPLLTMLFTPDASGCSCVAPRNLVEIADLPTVESVTNVVVEASAALILFAVALQLVRRWRAASPAYRRTLRGVYVAGGIGLTMLGVSFAAETVSQGFGSALVVGSVLALSAVPVIMLGGLLGMRRARAVVGRVVDELGTAPAPGHLRDVLRRALHDPSLEVGYRLADGYVDIDGRRFDPAAAPAATYVDGEGGPIGVLTHDAAIREDDVLDGLASAVRLVMENERLHADLRAKLSEIDDSRLRIVRAADEARQKLERNLHDGAQQRLVSLSIMLRLADAKLDRDPAAARETLHAASSELKEALAELRELARGIHPAILTERGLGPALLALAERAGLPVDVRNELDGRLSPEVEAAAYYLVAEALTNVAKHAQAHAATVRISRRNGLARVEVEDDGVGGIETRGGTGLRGLADRIAALDGTLSVGSLNGSGTRVTAEIPCT